MYEIIRIELPVPFAIATVNVYVVKGERLTLIDTGTKTEECKMMLMKKLGEIGYRMKDIESVILTHHHADHCGLLNEFRDDVEIIGHPWNEPWISQDEDFIYSYDTFFRQSMPKFGIPRALSDISLKRTLEYSCKRSLTTSIREGDIVDILPEFTVLETPGHASTHIALFRERDGLLIGGDVLLARISSNPLLEPPYHGETQRTKPLLQYNDTLSRLAEMPISRMITGHGEDITNVQGLVQKRLHKQTERAHKVLNMLKERPMTAFEVCVKLFPTAHQKQLAFTISETVGQLDYLEYNQQVMMDPSSDSWIYYAK
ncbi:MBL fold metallo-hydrolase [Ectobacillus sp. sgz5001026]|uniref:MBL fold metallo-hydrolase n=1 Tax=Ectobacillus sp. sgz5001026 TaxID=3242473 RepID=UPI0036D3A2F9